MLFRGAMMVTAAVAALSIGAVDAASARDVRGGGNVGVARGGAAGPATTGRFAAGNGAGANVDNRNITMSNREGGSFSRTRVSGDFRSGRAWQSGRNLAFRDRDRDRDRGFRGRGFGTGLAIGAAFGWPGYGYNDDAYDYDYGTGYGYAAYDYAPSYGWDYDSGYASSGYGYAAVPGATIATRRGCSCGW